MPQDLAVEEAASPHEIGAAETGQLDAAAAQLDELATVEEGRETIDAVPDFAEFLGSMEPRFLQERSLGLDFYYSGLCGLAVLVLSVAFLTVFLLALFGHLRSRWTALGWLLGTGFLALLCGLLATWLNFKALPTSGERIVNSVAGPDPVTLGQEAAVVALPLLLGTIVAIASLLGSLYLSFFWGVLDDD